MCGFEIGFSTIIYINAPAINGIGNIWLDGFAAMDPRVLQNHDDTQMSCGAKAFDQFDGSAKWVMTPNVSLPAPGHYPGLFLFQTERPQQARVQIFGRAPPLVIIVCFVGPHS